MSFTTELADHLYKTTGALTRVGAGDISRAVLDYLHERIAGGDADLPGIGRFMISDRAEKRGRNPSTGEPMTVPACKVIKFQPSAGLKREINGQ
jgi:DNA-binding protein HU-beta